MLTMGTFLMIRTTNGEYELGGKKYDLLCTRGITEYPDPDGEIQTVENTTLSDTEVSREAGLPDRGETVEYPTWFDKTDKENIDALDASKTYPVALWFGGTLDSDGKLVPSGELDTSEINAQIRYVRKGAGTNEVRPASIVLIPSNQEPTVLAKFPATTSGSGSEG